MYLTKNIIKKFIVDCLTIVNGDPGYCSCHSCSEFEGDCDYHNQCQEGLHCRLNNCPASLGFDSLVDCCQQIGNEHYCTAYEPCEQDEGDCDSHNECQDGLFCGSNNCPASLGFDSEVDCCYKPTLGDELFCTTDNPCGENEGDCHSDSECKANLVCDTINSCPTHLGFAFDVNCCSIGFESKFINA